MNTKQTKQHRFNIDLSPMELKDIETARSNTGAATKAEVIRRAVKLYALQTSGALEKEIFIRYPDGKGQRVILA